MVRNENTEFLLGDALLAAPVSQPGVRARAVYLPAGRWMDFWTGERFDGGGHVLADAPPARMPLYVKLPSLIPMIPVVQSTAEFHEQPLELRLFGADEGRACRSSYYEDDADSLAYADGAFSLYTITWEPDGVTGGNLRIHPEQSGFTGSRPRWELLLADGGDDAESVAPIDLGLPAADEARVHRIDVPTS
jgi:alpha-glucosidase